MECLDSILADWWSCRPDGAVAPARRLHEVVNRATERVEHLPATYAARQDAYSLLEPTWIDDNPVPPLFIQMLRVDTKTECIHFLRFWQAMQEVFRRTGQLFGQANDEPIAEEAAAFRDALQRRSDATGKLSCVWLLDEASDARAMSADEAAWASLQDAFKHASSAKEGGLDQPRADEAHLQREEAAGLFLHWLQVLTDDYCRGSRAAKLRAVRDVTGCSTREASFHLGSRGWEIEAALCSYYSVGPRSSAMALGDSDRGWSSHGAKLRRSEVECPICVEPYTGEPVVTSCCFQVLCSDCRAKLIHPNGSNKGFHCPFCRTLKTLARVRP